MAQNSVEDSRGAVWLLLLSPHGIPVVSRTFGIEAPPLVTQGLVNGLFSAASEAGAAITCLSSESGKLAYLRTDSGLLSLLTSHDSVWGLSAGEDSAMQLLQLVHSILEMALGASQLSSLMANPNQRQLRLRLQEALPCIDGLLQSYVRPVSSLVSPVWVDTHAVCVSLALEPAVTHMFTAEYCKAIGCSAAALGDRHHGSLHAGTDTWWSYPVPLMNTMLAIGRHGLSGGEGGKGRGKGGGGEEEAATSSRGSAILSFPIHLPGEGGDATLLVVPLCFDSSGDDLDPSSLSPSFSPDDDGLFLLFVLPSQNADATATAIRKVVDALSRTPSHVVKRLHACVSTACSPPNPSHDSIHIDSSKFVFEGLPADFGPGGHAEVFGVLIDAEWPEGTGTPADRVRVTASRVFAEDPFSPGDGPSQISNLHYSMSSLATEAAGDPDAPAEVYVKGKDFLLSYVRLPWQCAVVVAVCPTVPPSALCACTTAIAERFLSSLPSWVTHPALTRLAVKPA